jgi:uncharacterized protein (DUF2126 family)
MEIAFSAILTFIMVLDMTTLPYSSTSWSTGQNMRTGRSELAGAIVGIRLRYGGGMERTTNLVEVYDPQPDKWSTAASLPEKLDHAAAAPYDGKILVVSGFNKNGISTK